MPTEGSSSAPARTAPAGGARAAAEATRFIRGTRAGLLVFGGIAALNLGNALFHLIAARALGPASYSEVVSLLALSGLIILPLGGAQFAVARFVSDDAARRRYGAVAAFTRRIMAAAAIAALLVTVLLLLLSPLIRRWLGIDGLGPVVLAALYMCPALLAPAAWGVAQGLQRFGILASSLSAGAIARLVFLVALVPVGVTVNRVLLTTLLGGIVGVLVAAPLIRGLLRRDESAEEPPADRAVLAYLLPVIVGTLAITSLTTVDLLVAKTALSETSAGIYGSASLIARLILYAPGAIATVLLTKVSWRAASERETGDILSASLAVTALISLLGTALIVALPHLVIESTFGSKFGTAAPLLGPLSVAMTIYALLNVQLVYQLGRGRTGMAWILLAGAGAQIVLYAFVHGSTYQIIAADLATAAALLVLHEVAYERTLPGAARWLWQTARTTAPSVRMAAARARPARVDVLAVAVFAAAALLWLAPLVAHLNGSFLADPADGSGTVRDYWAASEQGTSIFGLRHDDLLGAPEGTPRVPSLQWANGIQPTIVLGLQHVFGRIGGWNVFLLLGIVLSASITYAVLRRLGVTPLSSVFGGYAYGFAPFVFEKAYVGHAAFVHVWVFPLLALALLRLHERRTPRSALLAGLVVAVAFYLHSYFGLIALLMVGVFFVLEAIVARGLAEKLYTATLLWVCAATTGLLLAPVALAIALSRSEIDRSLSQPTSDLQRFGARLPDYVFPSTHHPLFGDLVSAHWDPRSAGEPTLFYGLTTMVLAAAAVVLFARRRTRPSERFPILFAAVLAVVAFVFSLPRISHVGPVAFPAPSYVTGQAFTYFRDYARFGVLVGCGLVLLASFALSRLERRPRGRMIVGALLVLLAFELAVGPPVPTWAATRAPAYVAWLARHPGGIMATYPTLEAGTDPDVAALAASDLWFQVEHGHPLYTLSAGNTGGTREDAIRILSRRVDDPLTPHVLAAEGVRYVVVHDDVFRKAHQPVPNVPSESYRELAALPGVRIYAVEASPVDLDRTLEEHRAEIGQVQGLHAEARPGAGFGAPHARSGEQGWRTLRRSGELEVETGAAGSFTIVARAAAPVPTRVRLARDGTVLGEVSVGPAPTPILFGPFALPGGTSTLTLGADGPVEMSPIVAQALADFSVSLREDG